MLKKSKKRFISLLMVVSMIMTMIPFSAFANETTSTSDNTITLPTASTVQISTNKSINAFFANGTPITITKEIPTNGQIVELSGLTNKGTDAYVSWQDNGITKYVGVSKNITVVGGKYANGAAVSVPNTGITMTGGTVNNIYGGNYGMMDNDSTHTSTVTGNVIMNFSDDAVVLNLLHGGGAFNTNVQGTVYMNFNNVENMNDANNDIWPYINGGVYGNGPEGSRDIANGKMNTNAVVNNVEIEATNSNLYLLGAGGSGSTKVKNGKVTLNNCTLTSLFLGGINGEVENSTITTKDCTITDFAATNRGFVGTGEVSFINSKITNFQTGATEGCFASDSGTPDGSGVTQSVTYHIDGDTTIANAFMTPYITKETVGTFQNTFKNVTIDSEKSLNIAISKFQYAKDVYQTSFSVPEDSTLTLNNVQLSIADNNTLENIGTIKMDNTSSITIPTGATLKNAGTISGTVNGQIDQYVARVNGVGYATLEEALNATSNNDIVYILENITISSPISTKKSLTFEGVTKADGTKPVIRSTGANGLFSQAGDAVYTIKNLTLETSSDGQWYIYHSANTLTIEYCDFIMAEDVSNTGNVVMGEGNPSTDEDYTLIFKNNTITANSRAALTGVGNNSVISENIINLLKEKHGSSESRTSIIALTAIAEKGAVTISDNTFKNANRAIAVDNSSLSASDLTVKNNQFINVRFAFELSPTKNVNQGTFDLSKNYYNFNDTVSALKIQNADSEGDKFNFGEGSSEYLPEGANLVITEPYYTAPTMKDEDLNTYVPPTTGGGSTVIPTPDPEEPSDSEETVTNPDGSTTTTITKEDGSSSTTTVGTDGKVDSEVTVSKDAVDKADGSAVTLPMPEVAVTTDKDTAATVTVNLPSKDATKVEVPVKDVTPGTVAVLVDADGNETVIKDTVQSDNGITVEVTDGTTIKVVDNSKSFDDVTDNYWGADAIDFATSRELFAGTGENTFSPEGDMTRAMIWSVLARYEGADTSGASGDEWYAGPQEWAIENGISDGTMANDSMTREQLAAMLYRYVGSPAVSGTVGDYSDADSISSWASDAMVWAVQEGLIAGMGENTLNPQGTATRTQVAAILQRFIENKMA